MNCKMHLYDSKVKKEIKAIYFDKLYFTLTYLKQFNPTFETNNLTTFRLLSDSIIATQFACQFLGQSFSASLYVFIFLLPVEFVLDARRPLRRPIRQFGALAAHRSMAELHGLSSSSKVNIENLWLYMTFKVYRVKCVD